MIRRQHQLEQLAPRLPLDGTAALVAEPLSLSYGGTAHITGTLSAPDDVKYYQFQLAETSRVTIKARWDQLDDAACRVDLLGEADPPAEWQLLRSRSAQGTEGLGCQPPPLDGLVPSGAYVIGFQGAAATETDDSEPNNGGEDPAPDDDESAYAADVRLRATRNVAYEPYDGGYVLNFDSRGNYDYSHGFVTGAVAAASTDNSSGTASFTPAATFFSADTTSLVLLDGEPFDVQTNPTGDLVARRSSLAGPVTNNAGGAPTPVTAGAAAAVVSRANDLGPPVATVRTSTPPRVAASPVAILPVDGRLSTATIAVRGELGFVGALERGLQAAYAAIADAVAMAARGSMESVVERVAHSLHCDTTARTADELFTAIEQGIWSLAPARSLVDGVRTLLMPPAAVPVRKIEDRSERTEAGPADAAAAQAIPFAAMAAAGIFTQRDRRTVRPSNARGDRESMERSPHGPRNPRRQHQHHPNRS